LRGITASNTSAPQARAHIVGNLIGQAVAPIEHGQRHPDDAKIGVEALLHALDRLEQLAQPFEREEFALQRNQQGIGRTSALSVSRPSDGGQSMKAMS
jgi:hypothetical protein